MAGFGGSPVAALLGGAASGITQGAGIYQDLLNQQLARQRQQQIMQLAMAEEERARAAEGRTEKLFGPQYEAALLAPDIARTGLETSQFNLERGRTGAAREETYLGGLMGGGIPEASAVGALLGRPSLEAVQLEPDILRADLEGRQASTGYTRALTGQVGRGGGGGTSQSDINAIVQMTLQNEPLGNLLEAETVYMDQLRNPELPAATRASIARELQTIQEVINARLKGVPETDDDRLDRALPLFTPPRY